MPSKESISKPKREIDALKENLERMTEAHEKNLIKMEELTKAFSRILSPQLLKLLKVESVLDLEPGSQVEKEMTILFSDIRDFTKLSEQMTPQQNFAFINEYLGYMERGDF